LIPPRPDGGGDPSLVTDSRSVPGRPVATWRWFEFVGVFLLGFFIATLAALPVYALLHNTSAGGASGVSELAQTAVTDVVLVGVLVAWLSRKYPDWRAAIGFPPKGRRLREAAIGAGFGLLLLLVATIASTLILALLQAATGGAKQSLPQQVRSDLSRPGLAVFVLVALVVAPVTEEFVFRGLIFRRIRARHGFWLAAAVSSLLFGAVHYVSVGDWQSSAALQATMVLTGLGLATIYERRGNLLADIAGHAAFNTIAVITVLSHAMH
jgi:membrane protease YdiL (CAAX protease family)